MIVNKVASFSLTNNWPIEGNKVWNIQEMHDLVQLQVSDDDDVVWLQDYNWVRYVTCNEAGLLSVYQI